jgi:NADH-quinone oxidoreductase subunit M
MFDALFDPAARELDLIVLSVLVFLPAATAALLFLVPGRFREGMRWVALFGTAFTLALSLCVLVDYLRLLEFRSDRTVRSLYHPDSRLDARLEAQQAESGKPVPGPFKSDDLVATRPWIAPFGVNYALGVDGLSLSLVILTALVTMLAVVASWTIEDQLRGYLVLLLTLESGVIGAFLSVDLFLFYVFYEVMLLPMYFLIGVWGGGRRKYAAVKFVIYTLLGSVGLLAAVIALYSVNVRDFVDQGEVRRMVVEVQGRNPRMPANEALKRVEVHTFDPFVLSRVGQAVMLVLTGQEDRIAVRGQRSEDRGQKADGGGPQPPGLTSDLRPPTSVPLFAPGVDRAAALAALKASPVCTPTFQYLIFALLAVGFAVKVPVVPLHSWLPDAHVEAPTPVSMVLAGVLLKLGGYGLIRFAFPLCPWAAHELAWYVGLVGAVGIVYGAVVAMGQTDFKKLLAYSSVSHMGYVLLGLAAWAGGGRSQYWEMGVNGAVFQMLAHGVTASALFFVVGVVYDRAHHRELNHFGGLKEPMPVYAGMSAVLFFASVGLPGLCGFVGEFMTVLAMWNYSPPLAVAAILATVLTAGYLLWAWQRVYLGVNPATAAYPDLSAREASVLLPFVLLAIALGVLPGFLVFQWVEPGVSGWVEELSRLL